MTVAQFASTNLHDPVLPVVRPVPVALRCSQTIADAHAAIRAAPKARHVPYFYVLDDEDRLAGVVAASHLLGAQLDERVERIMVPGVVAIPSWATVLIASSRARPTTRSTSSSAWTPRRCGHRERRFSTALLAALEHLRRAPVRLDRRVGDTCGRRDCGCNAANPPVS